MTTDTAPIIPGFSKVACDQCHRCKLRCSRELPQCDRCAKIKSPCTFSTGKPMGKPRGSKNKNPRRESNPAKRKHDEIDSGPSLGRLETPKRTTSEDQWNALKATSPLSNTSNRTGTIFDTQDQAPGRDNSLGSYSSAGTGSVSPSIGAQNLPTVTPVEQRYNASPANALTPSQNINTIDFQPAPAPSAPMGTSDSSCTCSAFTMSNLVSLLPGALQEPMTSMLDQTLSLLKMSLGLCEQIIKCRACRHSSGALLSLSFIHRAMSHYAKILSTPFSDQRDHSSFAGGGFMVVTVGGLEVNRSLQGRILEAIVRAEMRAGVNLLMTCEKILGEDHGNLGGKVGAMEVQLAGALREEFEKYH